MKTTKFLLFALAVLLIGCQKDDIPAIYDTIEKNENITFRSCDLSELEEIAEALRSRIEKLLEQDDVFTNRNATGLVPQLNNLDRAILKGDCEEAQRVLEEDIIPHLQGLNEDGILSDDLYEELDNLAHGIFTLEIETIVMADGRTWTAENLTVEIESEDFTYGEDYWWYLNDQATYNTFGLLYTWDAADAACKSLGPKWRLPSIDEWIKLGESFGEEFAPGIELGWLVNYSAYINLVDPQDNANTIPNNFNARLAGVAFSGAFFGMGEVGAYWTLDIESLTQAYPIGFWTESGNDIMVYGDISANKSYGYSCRCILDEYTP